MKKRFLFYLMIGLLSITEINATNKDTSYTENTNIESETIDGGVIPINKVIDLSEYYIIDGEITQFGSMTNNAPLYPERTATGIYNIPQQVASFYIGSKFTIEMTNKNFSGNKKYFTFTVGEADMKYYHKTDLEGLKLFLNQDGTSSKKNYEAIGLTKEDMNRWDGKTITKLNLGWTATNPSRIQKMDMYSSIGGDISGNFDLSYFPMLEEIRIINSHLTGVSVTGNDKLTTIALVTDGKFSTIPVPIPQYKNYGYSFNFTRDTTIYKAGDIIDFSSEYKINGNITVYDWVALGMNNVQEAPISMIELGNGKFEIPESVAGYSIACTMSNKTFPNAKMSYLTQVKKLNYDTIQGGEIPINHLIDLSNLYIVNGETTTFNTTDGAIDHGNGIFKMPEQNVSSYIGKNMIWELSNKNFTYGKKYFAFTVGKADFNYYHHTDLEGLKKFLLQDGANNIKNYEYFGLTKNDMDRWDGETISKTNIVWTATYPARIQKIDEFSNWYNKKIGGFFDLSYFPSLEKINISNTNITGIDASNNSKLKYIEVCYTSTKFSTLPIPTNQYETYNYNNLNTIVDLNKSVGDVVDLSSEFKIGNNVSTYKWSTDLMIDLGEGKFMIPAALEGKTIRCNVTNNTFAGSEVNYEIGPIKKQTIDKYNEADLAILKTFLNQKTNNRFNYENLNLTKNDMLNWSVETIEKISGINWTNSFPMEISKIVWKNNGLNGILDLSQLASLEYLDCSYNNLTSILVNDAIKTLIINDNKLTLADLPIINNNSTYIYNNQEKIDAGSISMAQIIDLNDQYLINNIVSEFKWYANNAEIEVIDLGNGKFKAGANNMNKTIECKITNQNFPNFTLNYMVKIDNSTVGIENNINNKDLYLESSLIRSNEKIVVINKTNLTGTIYLYSINGRNIRNVSLNQNITYLDNIDKGFYILTVLLKDNRRKTFKIAIQ